MSDQEEKVPNKLHKKFCERRAELDMDDTFSRAYGYHIGQIKDLILNDYKFTSREEYVTSLLNKFFVDQMHLHPRNEPVTDLKYDSPSYLLPFEAFIDVTSECGLKETRQQQMFKILHKGDVLTLEMIAEKNEEYELKVIEKVFCHRKLNDLDFLAYLPKKNVIVKLPGKELHASELIRAAISDFLQDFKVKVSFDETIVGKDYENIKLGRIAECRLPAHIHTAKKFSCTADYVRSLPVFWHPLTFRNAAKRMGMDLSRIYSYDSDWNGKKYPAETYGRVLAQNVVNKQANKNFDMGLQFYKSKNITSALESFDKSIQLSPSNARVFEMRGHLHMDMKEKGISGKAIIDWITALKINPDSKSTREGLSTALLRAAKQFAIRKKNPEKARKLIKISIQLNDQNAAAHQCLALMNRKYPNRSTATCTPNLHSRPLGDLEAEKQKIEAQLREYKKKRF